MRRVRAPADKSISHRALLFAAMADGRSRLRGVLPAGDPRSTAAVLRALGCAVPAPGDTELIIDGRGWRGWKQPERVLDCGNSGTTARLMLGALAGLPLRAVLDGDASLRGRPMRRVTAPLTSAGAHFEELRGGDGLPIAVRGGGLAPIRHASPVASGQVKSALLLAGLTGGAGATVTEPQLSRDHTERMLRIMGAPVSVRQAEGVIEIRCDPVLHLEPLDLAVPGDFSSAAFLVAVALLGDEALRIEGVGVNATRVGLLAVLNRMGADIALDSHAESAGEPVADLVVVPSALRGTVVPGAEIPAMVDEVPVLAVLALRAAGETRIEGAGELRVKESDRIAAIVQNIRAIGGSADELPDGLIVVGSTAPLRGRVRTHGDHRIAMAFAALAAAGNEIEVDDPGAADVSFPGFWQLLRALRALPETP